MKLPRFEDEKILTERLKTIEALMAYEKLHIGQQIKKLRARSHLGQKQLATLLHTSQSVIARIEAGKQNLTIHTLIKIAALLNKKIAIKFN